jgi:WbqC-like protein family
MKLAIMQPYFFPYIGYWQLIHAVDRFVIYDDVNYIKGGWINRNRILINGEPTYITVPLYQSSSYKRICDISLQSSPVWRDKLVKMVETTYRKAPCFAEVFSVVESVIRHDADSLSDYLVYQLQTLSIFMGIKTEFVVASRCYENNDLSGQARILDICKREGANTYINPQGGQALYDRVTFTRCGLELKFLIPSAIEYKQFGSTHQPWLSIIDVMMFNSRSQLITLLNKYEFV